MAYKDKDKQREAVKLATRRYRAKKGDSALLGQKQVSQNARGLTEKQKVGDTLPVIPSVIPEQQSYNPMMVGYVPPKGEV